MKIHKVITRIIQYPVEIYITTNLKIISEMAIALEKILPEDKSTEIIFCARGASGISISTLICEYLIKKDYSRVGIFHIKKPNEDTHKTEDLSIYVNTNNPLLIYADDIIASGVTIGKIHETVTTQLYSKDIQPFCIVVSSRINLLELETCSFTKEIKSQHIICHI